MTFHIESFTHQPFNIHSYLVWSEAQPECLMINAGREVAPIVAFCEAHHLKLHHIFHTHGFLEFLEGQPLLRDYYDLTAYMSPMDEFWLAHLDTQATILGVNTPPMAFVEQQVNDGETIMVGDIEVRVIHTPGNSPGGMSYYLPQLSAVFTGDTCYRGYLGATDVPHGNAELLQTSVQTRLWTLPEDTQLLPGRGLTTTVAAEKSHNTLQCVAYGKPLPELMASHPVETV